MILSNTQPARYDERSRIPVNDMTEVCRCCGQAVAADRQKAVDHPRVA